MLFLSQKRLTLRDLRAKNCIVDNSKKVKISYFKFCQNLGNYDQYVCADQVARERMPWAAPETIAENISSVKSDVFSYGMLMWEVYSQGKEPYSDMSDVQITTFLLEEKRLSKPDKCPDVVYKVMLDCWKTDPEERPTFGDISRSIAVLVLDN